VIIVAGTFEVEPEQREEFLASRHEAMRNSRSEAGCLEYTFSADPLDPARVMLFERWESQEALDAHLAALRAKAPATGGVNPVTASVVFYDVVAQRGMGG
jgi:quinol monooxygenase YgiN